MVPDGRMVVPAVVDGAATWLQLDTVGRYELAIDLAYARERGWPYERRSERWGRSPVADVFALGRAHGRDTVSVYGRDSDTTLYGTAGNLGVRYVNRGVLAFDPVDVALGWSAGLDLEVACPRDTHRVALVPGTDQRVPVTLDLLDASAPGGELQLAVDLSSSRSAIALTYVQRAWPGWRKRRQARRAHARQETVEMHLHLPDGTCTRHPMAVVDSPGPGYDTLGTHVDGYLGVDFLYRWLPVIDFPRATLWLAPLRTP